MRIRVRTALVVGLIGAVGLFLYPPVQGATHMVPVDSDIRVEPAEPDVVFDAGSAQWRWTVSDRGFALGRKTFTFRVYEARLLAQIGLWTAFVVVGAFVGGRVARWPGPAGVSVRWAALLATGFASANVGLALLLDHPDLAPMGQLAANGEWGRAVEVAWEDLFRWGYGFVLPYAALAWGLGVLLGYLRRSEAGRDWAREGSPSWAKGARQWPRGH
jgi:hypothetical protein